MTARQLNAAQLGVWYGQRMDPGNPVFNQGGYMELRGPIDIGILRTALELMVASDEALRLRFTEVDGVPSQFLGPATDFTVDVLDMSAEPDPLAAAIELMRADMAVVPDLERDRLFTHVLFKLGSEHVVWYNRAHHLIHDGHTSAILRRRAAELYAELAATGELAGPVFGSFAHVLDEGAAYIGSAAQRRDAQYWQKVMGGAAYPASFGLADKLSNRLAREISYVDADVFARLREFGDRAGVSWQQALIAAAAIHRYIWTGDRDVVLSLPVSGRVSPTAHGVPGMMANVLPLRCGIDFNETCEQLASRVAAQTLRAQWHQRYDSSDLLRDLGWPANGRRLFGPVINIFGDEPPTFAGTPMSMHLFSTGGTAEDLSLTVTRSAGDQLRIDVTIDSAHQDAVDLGRYLASFHQLIDSMTAGPGVSVAAVEALGAERELVAGRWSGPVSSAVDGCLGDLFEAHVSASPDAVALVCDGVGLSYGELNARANRLARLLVAQGVRPGAMVGVLLHRSLDFAVALVAVVKAGAGYVVLDPEFPDERLGWVVAESGVGLVVSSTDQAARVPGVSVVCVEDPAVEGQPGGDLGVAVSPSGVACVMFTSGSTGRPKGVVSSHRVLVGSLVGQSYASFGPDEVFLQCSPVSWDAFSLEFWGALLFGGRCVLQPGQRPEPARINELVAGHGVTMLQLSSSLFNFLVDETPEVFAGVRLVFTGGEAASPSHVDRIMLRYPQLRVTNGYGPAESMGFTTTYPIAGVWGASVPIGVPVANKRAYVLDGRLQPVPVGVVGEVYLGGVGLAHGYLNQPGTTAQRFVADPIGAPGDRLYRTGDLARWLPGGVLDFMGRVDDQVKVRGFRVEPGEVEAVLVGHEEVSQAAVIAHESRLVAYVVGAANGRAVREWLRGKLPDHMVPAAVVVLERLPLTANGKLDRRALPEPQFDAATAGRAPRTPQEEILCGLFAEILGVPTVSIDDSFFDLGGHSLLAARLAARIRATLGLELTIADIFHNPTPVALSEGHNGSGRQRPALVAGPRPASVPLSYAQHRLWFLNKLEGPSATYNVPLSVRLRGDLDVEALQAAFGDLVRRHEVLRTVYESTDGQPCQRVLDADGISFTRCRVEASSLDEHVRAAARHPFDLAAEPPIRVTLFDVDDDGYLLLVLLHHIATDGLSVRPLFSDLATAYRARLAVAAPDWVPLPVQYADYALWQRQVLGEESDPDSVLSGELAHWRETLAGLPEELGLPLDRPRPVVAGHRGGAVVVEWDQDLHRRLVELARAEKCTLFMVLQAALAVTLSRFGAGQDIPIGSPVAGRSEEALDDMVGFFVNMLVLRTDVAGNPSFRDLLARVRAADLDAYAHQDMPFDRLLEALNPVRSLSRHPLFQVCLALETDGGIDVKLPAVQAESASIVDTSTAKFDLELLLREGGDSGIAGAVLYSADIFDRPTVERMVTALRSVLEQVVADPGVTADAVDVLGADRELVVRQWNATSVGVEDRTLGGLFDASVAASPDAVALVCDGVEVSYGELNARSNRLARLLVARGVRPGAMVGVFLHRSLDFAVALVAVVKAGAGYVVLDPEFPDERLGWVVAESGVSLVVSSADLVGRVPGVSTVPVDGSAVASLSDEDLGVVVSPSGVACVMFTSGSTGRPKGVVSSHRVLVGSLLGQRYASFGPREVFLQCSPVSWDAFSLEFWGALLFGGRCVLQPGQRPEPARINELVAGHGVTMLQLSSSLFNFLVDESPEVFASVELVFTGGEAASPSHVDRIMSRYPHLRVTNGYGPAESMGFTTTYPIEAVSASTVPIGAPVANKRAYVLDGRLRPVPVGVVGEVYLGGIGLAHGYLNQPGVTAQRFVADPFSQAGERLYRTGDQARWLPSGALDFIGRADSQVKIRGFRVEPGEVEAVLVGHEQVSQAAVVAYENRLVAYIVGSAEGRAVREWLRGKLPDHMVPAAVMVLERLPLTPNGKLDRRALPEPQFDAATAGRAPRTAQEEILCGLFAEVLGVPTVSIDDSFFDLGGHSLLAARLAARAGTSLGLHLTIADIFHNPTPVALTAHAKPAGAKRSRPALRKRT